MTNYDGMGEEQGVTTSSLAHSLCASFAFSQRFKPMVLHINSSEPFAKRESLAVR